MDAEVRTRAGEAWAEAEPTRELPKRRFERRVDAMGYEVVVRVPEDPLARCVRCFNKARIPARYHDRTIDGFIAHTRSQGDARVRCLDVTAAFSPGDRGLGLSGAPGVGKTHLLAGLARFLTLEEGFEVQYADFSALVWDLKAGFEAGRGETDLLRPLLEVPVLFIDELGKGRGSDWERQIVDAIVSGRYDRNLSTFVATNHPIEATHLPRGAEATERFMSNTAARLEPLADRLGPRVWSRLSEMCSWLNIEGPDARRR